MTAQWFSTERTALALGLLALFLFIVLKLLGHARRKQHARNTAKGAGRPPAAPAPQAPPVPAAPALLRPEEAEQLFRRLQAVWDARDLESAAKLATPAMTARLLAQAAEDPEPSRTGILRLKAEILKTEEREGAVRAEVYFSMLLREEGRGAELLEEREVWLFSRALPGGPWLLDAIQHVQ